MKAVVAIDSLKGSLSSSDAGNAVLEGIKRVYPDAVVQVFPVADGGEGTVDALICGMNGARRHISVKGPLGIPVQCSYGIVKSSATAIIEMAEAAGLTLISEQERNPLYTTSYGVGEIIRDAIDQGCRRFLVGIGGSATNDGGVGMLQALGFEFLDKAGVQIPLGAQGLERLARISDTYVIPELKSCVFHIACDVTNPLCGSQGCSTIFGPQKGADAETIDRMDNWLKKYAELTLSHNPRADRMQAGTGAAGGLGFAFLAYTNARLEPGIKMIMEAVGLEDAIQKADLVITGEGRIDFQTAMGKAPSGVAKIAKKYKKPVIAFSGAVTEDAVICNKNGIDAFFPILRTVTTLNEAIKPENARRNMTDTVEQVFRLIKTISPKV